MSKTNSENSFAFFAGAIISIAQVFAAGCNTAPPPRPVEGSSAMASAGRTARPVPPRDPKAIESASDVAISKLDGGTFKLADFRGKVLVLDFWATYCPPCVKQVPQLAEMSRKYRDRGVEVVGLTSDEKKDQQMVADFLKKAGADYIIGFDNQWISTAFLKGTEDDTGAPPIPQLFVISRDGRVVEHLIGDSPERGIEYIEKVVNQQLAMK